MTGRRDVEALLAAKLDPRHQEVELDAVGMRVPHPQHLKLVRIEPWARKALEGLDDLALLIIGWSIFCCEADDAGLVSPLMGHCVDEVLHPGRVAFDHFGKRITAHVGRTPLVIEDGIAIVVVGLYVFGQQVVDRRRGVASTVLEELDHHRRCSSSRSASSSRSMATKAAETAMMSS